MMHLLKILNELRNLGKMFSYSTFLSWLGKISQKPQMAGKHRIVVLTAPSIFSTVFVLVSLSNCIFPCLKKEGRMTVLRLDNIN